ALAELAGVAKAELTDVDLSAYDEAAIRVNASRWAAVSATPPVSPVVRPTVVTQPGQPGETCVLLVDAKNGATHPLARRCTYALVWAASASLNREGNALSLAVQPMAAWRELWVFRKQGAAWVIDVLPPGTANPELGYAEFAGWVPGGKQMLVARESVAAGRHKRSYELVRLDSLTTERQAGDAMLLGAFQRWQDPSWKRMTVSLR
ncbi:MAG TPA: hypothetical protein VK981_09845, partial [Ramlibacter sp.]|nr:hypothetical protein [Ramlibacter sp.]